MDQQHSDTTTSKRHIWIRGLYMLLMGLVFQLAGTLLFIIAVIQFVLALLNDTPNVRLMAFGRNLGSYVKHIVSFLTFATEEIPFPFSDWPAPAL